MIKKIYEAKSPSYIAADIESIYMKHNEEAPAFLLDLGKYGAILFLTEGDETDLRLEQICERLAYGKDEIVLGSERMAIPFTDYQGFNPIYDLQGFKPYDFSIFIAYVGDRVETIFKYDLLKDYVDNLDPGVEPDFNTIKALVGPKEEARLKKSLRDGIQRGGGYPEIDPKSDDWWFIATYANEIYPMSDSLLDIKGLNKALRELRKEYGFDMINGWIDETDAKEQDLNATVNEAYTRLEYLRAKYGKEQVDKILDDHDNYSN